MAISIDIPPDIERLLREEIENLDQAAKEAFLVDLYRQRKLTHHRLAQALGRSRLETDALLKHHNVFYDLSVQDVARESDELHELRGDNDYRR